VASTYLNNGAFRGPFDEASSAPLASQGGAAGGHSARHRSREEDSATPCPFYMKTGTCAYGDMCAPLARFARCHASIGYSFAAARADAHLVGAPGGCNLAAPQPAVLQHTP